MKIRFVVPDQFRGLFILAVDPKAEPVPLESGHPVFRIPNKGILYIEDGAVFKDWYSKEAFYASGEVLPSGRGAPVEPYDLTVKLYSVGADSVGRFYFLVGTEEELAEVLKTGARFPGGVPPLS